MQRGGVAVQPLLLSRCPLCRTLLLRRRLCEAVAVRTRCCHTGGISAAPSLSSQRKSPLLFSSAEIAAARCLPPSRAIRRRLALQRRRPAALPRSRSSPRPPILSVLRQRLFGSPRNNPAQPRINSDSPETNPNHPEKISSLLNYVLSHFRLNCRGVFNLFGSLLIELLIDLIRVMRGSDV